MSNYIKYDELGVKSIHCMNCGLPIVIRCNVTVEIASIPPRTEKVMVMRKLASFRQKKLDLENGAYMELMLCDECIELDLDMNKMDKAVVDGWDITLRAEGKTKKEIKRFKKAIPKIKKTKIKRNKYELLTNEGVDCCRNLDSQ